jgi:hypothetical protein
MALMESQTREVIWCTAGCRLCGTNFCVDRDWLASTYGPGAELPAECPRCDPLSFLEMPRVHQPWHP